LVTENKGLTTPKLNEKPILGQPPIKLSAYHMPLFHSIDLLATGPINHIIKDFKKLVLYNISYA